MTLKKETKKKKVVYTSIVGDFFHIGHLNLLRRAKRLGDFLIVGVLTEDAVKEYKRKPIISFLDRIQIIDALDCVDQVIPQNTRDGTENLKKLKVDILTRGNDIILKEEVDYIKSIGGEFVHLEYTGGVSTTDIINKVKNIDIHDDGKKQKGKNGK